MERLAQFAVVAVLAGASMASAAQGQTLDWSYTFADGNVLSGVFTGTDAGNYFTVTGLQSLSFNGVPTAYLAGAPILSVDAFTNVGEGYNGNGSAVVTLDGSYMDLLDTPDAARTGFDFFAGDLYAQQVGSGEAFLYIPSVGSDVGYFAKANWSATLVGAAVPEPGTVAVLLTGMLGLAMARGRKLV
jgi:hypothetical protein